MGSLRAFIAYTMVCLPSSPAGLGRLSLRVNPDGKRASNGADPGPSIPAAAPATSTSPRSNPDGSSSCRDNVPYGWYQIPYADRGTKNRIFGTFVDADGWHSTRGRNEGKPALTRGGLVTRRRWGTAAASAGRLARSGEALRGKYNLARSERPPALERGRPIGADYLVPALVGRGIDRLSRGISLEPGDRAADSLGEGDPGSEVGHESPDLGIVEYDRNGLVAAEGAFRGRQAGGDEVGRNVHEIGAKDSGGLGGLPEDLIPGQDLVGSDVEGLAQRRRIPEKAGQSLGEIGVVGQGPEGISLVARDDDRDPCGGDGRWSSSSASRD